MEFFIYFSIFIVFYLIFKITSYENQNPVYNEKQLLRNYIEIKKVNPDIRMTQVREWEEKVKLSIQESEIKGVLKIVPFERIK